MCSDATATGYDFIIDKRLAEYTREKKILGAPSFIVIYFSARKKRRFFAINGTFTMFIDFIFYLLFAFAAIESAA